MKIADYLDKKMGGARSHNRRDELPERLKSKHDKMMSDEDDEDESPSNPSVERLAKLLGVDASRLGEMLKDAIDELNE